MPIPAAANLVLARSRRLATGSDTGQSHSAMRESHFYIQSNEKEELVGINDEIHTQDTVIPWQWPVMVNQGYPWRWRFLSLSGTVIRPVTGW